MTSRSPVVIAGTAAITHCGLGVRAFWREVVRRSELTPRNDGTMRRFVPTKPPENSRREIHSDHRLTAYLLSAIEYDLGNSLTALSDEERDRRLAPPMPMLQCLNSAFGLKCICLIRNLLPEATTVNASYYHWGVVG